MTDRSPTHSIDDDLADWLIAHDRGLTAREADDFDLWLGQSPAHALAWSEIAPLWESLDQAGEDDAFAAMLEDARDAAPARSWLFARPGRMLLGGGLAFVLALGIFVVAPGHLAEPDRQAMARQDFSTGYRSADYQLADGTRITLDAGSALSFAIQGNARMATLTRGRAYLDVHHDAARPFSVTAGGATITDVGTQFGISSENGGLSVMLVSGKVAISDPVTSAAAVMLVPGQQFKRVGNVAGGISSVDAGAALSWRDGYVEFDRTPLTVAIAEINRYTPHPLRIGDPVVGRLLVSGRFKAGDPDRFAQVLALTYPVKLATDPQGRVSLDPKP